MFSVATPITTGSSEIPLWLWIFATLGVGILAAAPGLIKWWLDSRGQVEKRANEQRHLAKLAQLAPRLEATADAVLGQEAEPAIGRYARTPGLIDVVPDIQKVIGRRNGKTVMEHIDAIEEHLGMEVH